LEFEQRLRATGMTLSCKRGCANCCRHPFLISIAEGLLLYRWLAAHGRWSSIRKRVVQARDTTINLAFEVWCLANLPCPLLENEQCLAYEARPLHCRATFAMNDPQMCHPHELRFATNLIPNIETVVNYNSKVRSLLKRVGVRAPLMPLAEAVLLGEAIDTGAIEIEDTDLEHTKDCLRA
jgi:Fe-S-cluster containining protein